RLGAMPVPLACLDVHDIADGYLTLFLLGRDHALAGRDHQDLVAVVRMPAGGGACAEVHDATAIVIGIPVTDDRLPGPAYRSSSPSSNGCGSVHGLFRPSARSYDTAA